MSDAFGMTITLVPSGAIIAAEFEDFAVGIRSLKEPLKEAIQKVVAPSIRKNFDAEGRPGWEPLSESRTEQKAQLGLNSDILNATGLLKRVASQLSIWDIDGGYGSGEAVASVDDLGNADYGGFHQDGIGVPQREFLLIQDEDEEGIVKIFDDYVAMRARRAGFH